MKKTLVTGATGFIGSHLVEELIKRGGKEKIRCLVLKKDPILKDINEKGINLLRKRGVEIFFGDLLDSKSLEEATKDVNKVFHLAAISRPMDIPKKLYYETNVAGTRNLLESCKKNNVKKFIYVSSMSGFGFSRNGEIINEKSPKFPVTDYGDSKKQGERLVHSFCKRESINFVIIRPPMVFGPRDYQFLKLFKAINTGFFPLLNKGSAKFEFCYVKNLIKGIILGDEYGRNSEDYNITDGYTYTIREVVYEISKALNINLVPIIIPVSYAKSIAFMFEIPYKIIGRKPPFGVGTASWMSNNNIRDISKAKKEINYKREIPLKKSISETVKWYKSRRFL
ncbi:NAD-dependent epimerase/dehydratase family protein [Candidatus Pacearchaeota archaeon]|nr:NAD-dependent epimerase/dehydratase family protein [Candidatus Pacearchaeota archaeon]